MDTPQSALRDLFEVKEGFQFLDVRDLRGNQIAQSMPFEKESLVQRSLVDREPSWNTLVAIKPDAIVTVL